jgi:predicted TPR repeat methyltransferase
VEGTTAVTSPDIRPLAAVHFREALAAAGDRDAAAALAALMHIDAESWQAIEHRLAVLGTTVLGALAACTANGGTTE